MTAAGTGRDGAVLEAGDLSVEFAATGEISAIRKSGMRVSQYATGLHDVAVGFLAAVSPAGELIHLTGLRSNSAFRLSGAHASWQGSTPELRWRVTLQVVDDAVRWHVRLDAGAGAGSRPGRWRVLAAQDLALAPEALASSAEPYVSQYVAHRRVDAGAAGIAVASRQTMAYAPRMPMTVLSIAEGADWFATDAYDVYGRAGRIDGLAHADLRGDGRLFQYEMAMAALASVPFDLDDPADLHIVLVVQDDSEEDLAAAALAALSAVASAEHPAVPGPGTMSALASSATPASLLATAPILVGDHVAEVDTGEGTAASDPDAWGSAEPVGFLESRKDGMPLSLFRGARHVVFRAKEEAVDRSHGHILLAGDQRGPDSVVMCATVSAAGVFLSNVAVGNSTENRLITVCRDPLSVQRASGLRILVRWEGAWRILGIPSVFTMDVGGCRWDYAIGDRRISVATVADPRDHTVRVSLRSDEALDVMAVVERVAGSVASGVPADGTTIVFGPGPDALAQRHCPGLALAVAVRDGMISDDGALFPDGAPRSAVHTTISASSTRAFDLVFSGALDGADAARDKARAAASSSPDVAADLEEHRTRLAQWTRRLRIAPGGRLAEFDVLVSWYAHDALVHLLSPHGLEQYSGAAWGTRDVLQGPYEFALALDRPEIARELLLRVLARQQADGSLPQWFMHDEYAEISQTDAHGDIVIWPLIALGQYLQATGDTGILAADVPFWDGDRQEPGRAPASVSDHLLATLKHLRDHRVPGTALPAYGGGDWDDSLQPLLPRLRSQMTSSWTTALLHQACQVLGLELEGAASDLAAEFAMEAGLLEEAFHRHLVIDGVVAGFVDFGSENERPLVHPRDRETGMRYRLVPMTRAVIAGLFTPEEADAHREIIERTLHYPDGVRLADAPAAYRDGATRLFLRAEQCANVGREIGLMYTHAHLRFVESLVALGRSAAAAELLRVSPVTPRRAAPHAALRQRNCYFSSSDADFPDRYTAAREWERLRAGSADPVAVRGGWRVYSSGPGIFLRMLVEGVLGLSVRRNELVVDPTLAPEDDGLEVELEIGGTLRTIRYRVAEGGDGVRVRGDGAVLPGRRLRRAYREGGVRIPLAALEGVSRIDVETPPGSDG